MAKFINTRKAVSEIEDLIKNAGEKLMLVSPYLRLSKDFKELLRYRNSKDKASTVIFRKQELNPDELKFLQGLHLVSLNCNEDLHAKCYANDDKMIITSLNLYEFSMANNKEMGVLIDKNDPADFQLFDDAMKEIDFIIQTSQRFGFSLPKTTANVKAPDQKLKRNGRNTGYCIRTRIEIPFDIDRPFSYDAYKKWSEYPDLENPENFCHFSGEPSNGETSFIKPILKKYWKRAQEVHGLY